MVSGAAGSHVRAAATLGGHLALYRARFLQSNLLPVLVALDAAVGVATLKGTRCIRPCPTKTPSSSALRPSCWLQELDTATPGRPAIRQL